NGGAPGFGGDAPDASSPAQSDALPCDVQTVLARSCAQCHSDPPLFGAPMALTTWTEVHAEASTIHARIHDDQRPMPPPPNARLDASAMATLDDWIARGAPAGDGATCSAPPSS